MTTADPAASAARTEPAGMATGKFHGGVTTVSLEDELGAVDCVEFLGQFGVVVGEVDGFGHFGVALVQRFAAL